jgi:transposase
VTCDKTDGEDVVLIARLAAQLRCYIPGPVDETWARLRHLGTRREQLITEAGSRIQQMRDLLECAWPAALDTARQPFRSGPWIAGLPVIAGRDGGGFARTRRLGAARLRAGGAARDHRPRRAEALPADRARAVQRPRRSGRGDRAPGRRAGESAVALEDWQHTQDRLAETQRRMTAVLDELGLTGLVTSMTGLSAIGAAAILAETSDPRRFATARAVVSTPAWPRGRNCPARSPAGPG